MLSRLLLLASLSFVALVQAVAEPRMPQPAPAISVDKRALQETYGGVVTDETVTVGGQDFYQCFVTAWRERDLSERYVISIHERPSARWGTRVWIEYAQRQVFQMQLPVGRTGIRALSEQAAEIAYKKITDIEVERLLFRDTDMGADEI
ncbi:MAG TPA: CsgE family curli-type amyloid fiber assembly protein [Noviherbaspirillum sp.]|uniref:CsgE family curli-type amyloid fiber assembly protein n=1 Tax=Noviherbaspirillum sp. TaxID=1926288 RepID=UPI002B4832C7|nr:CsgE family curli-type amyloid fiber assembly protein [Noviherbaspirillum sp.]HJV84721.1 CsgE family curli-type amyloid fiber assembly protein [Noviherbaspirillum sp.]